MYSDNSAKRATLASLTEEERHVIELLGKGFNSEQIVQQLGLTRQHVRETFDSIYTKLDLTDRLDLLLFAYEHGLAE